MILYRIRSEEKPPVSRGPRLDLGGCLRLGATIGRPSRLAVRIPDSPPGDEVVTPVAQPHRQQPDQDGQQTPRAPEPRQNVCHRGGTNQKPTVVRAHDQAVGQRGSLGGRHERRRGVAGEWQAKKPLTLSSCGADEAYGCPAERTVRVVEDRLRSRLAAVARICLGSVVLQWIPPGAHAPSIDSTQQIA
jgi:hypothetical protein